MRPSFDPSGYGPIIAALLAQLRQMPLGPGTPNEAVRSQLGQLDLKAAFAPHLIVDADMARACLAGLWLCHDFLDESHQISQEIRTPTGSYWHGIMHRREPDYENSKYWFRRVGAHPVFDELAAAALELGYGSKKADWDPFQFMDDCEKCRTAGNDTAQLILRVQQVEWESLFDWCFRRAVQST